MPKLQLVKDWDPDYLKKELPKVAADYAKICENNKLARIANETKVKGSTMRLIGRVPVSAVLAHPEIKKYFDPTADPESRKKDLDLLFKRFPEFKV